MDQQITKDASSKLNNAVKHAGERTRSAMGDMKAYQEDASDFFQTTMEDAKDSAQKAMEFSKSTITKYPFYSVLGAVAAGAALGVLLGRASKR